MSAWPVGQEQEQGDILGPTVTRAGSAKPATPPSLKNGSDLRESGYLISVGSRTTRFRRKHKSKLILGFVIILLLLFLCLTIVLTILYFRLKKHLGPKICESKECLRSASNLALSMDTSANPCDNFYQYTCGNWASEHPRPDAYRSYDWFRHKQLQIYSVIRDFLAKNTSHQPRPVQQAKDMFTACMNTDLLDKLGLKPAVKVLEGLGLPVYPTYVNISEDFDSAAYSFNWLETVIKVKTQLGMDVLIGFDIFSDPKNSSVYRLVMGSPETTNPFPTLYDKKRSHSMRRREKYRTRIKRKLNGADKLIQFDDNFEGRNKKSDDEETEKTAEVYKLYYAELIKLFVVYSGITKTSKLSEIDIDQNILLSANEHYSINHDLYELDTENTTEEFDVSQLDIPEYTVEEIQVHTDMIVESNNGTPTPIWKRYLEGIFAISDTKLDFKKDKILVSEPDLKYMSLMASLVNNLSPMSLELYIWVKVVEVLAEHTTLELRVLFHRLQNVVQGGIDTGVPPRSLQCANTVNDMMGMAVARGIADPRFLNVTRPKIKSMVNELKNALARLVGQANWMDDDTKLATYRKIIEMKTLIGFPEWILDEGELEQYYQGIEIDTEKHLENMISILQVKLKKALNKFRQGNNFTWVTDPTEVNAYHTFQENTITVPLVMLQYPFFDLGLDSLNYGSLGTVLGHEITHGFDNFGRQFDRQGNMVQWWSNATVESYINMTQCFVSQYSSFYVPTLDKHVDGKKTLGENIADNGGVREAFVALQHHLRRHGPESKLPGFEHMTSEQMFFLSYGNLWCGVATKDSLKAELEDEHSPQVIRARGALQNSEQFARAFKCRPGSPMNPRTRCIIF